MALSAHALTTLATLKGELGITDTGKDTVLERMIDAASAALEKVAGRHFENSATIAEQLRGHGDFRLFVSRTPLNSIGSIVLLNQDGTTASTFDVATYEIEDADQGAIYRTAGWGWTAQPVAGLRQEELPGSERAAIKVTYNGGWVTPAQAGTRTLPYDLEEACLLAAISLFRRRGQDREIATDAGGASVSYRSPPEGNLGSGTEYAGILPVESLTVARRYRRYV